MLRLFFVAAAFVTSWVLSPGSCNAVCKTASCEETAKRILDYMDPDVKPCDDFYQFTCGKLLKSKLPEGKSQISSFTQVQEAVDLQMRKLLEEPIEPKEHDAYKAAKKFYALCMDEKNSTSNVKEASKRLRLAGWPVLGGWKEDQWSLHEHETKLRALTLSGGGLFHLDRRPDPQNPGKAQITVDHPALTRQFLKKWNPEDDLRDTLELPHVRPYQNYMVDLAVMFGADRQAAEHQLRESLLFELDLEKIVDMPRGRHRPYELMTVAELQDRAGWVDWPALLAAAVIPKSLGLGTDELVKVYEPNYLDRLRRLVEQYPNRVIANFMGWRAAERLSLMLTPEMVNRKRQFDDDEEDEVTEPWQQCARLVGLGNLGLAVSSMYTKKYMTEETKQTVTELTSNVQEMMNFLIKFKADWMDDETKTRALLKLCKMHAFVGSPKELTKTKEIDEFYHGLNLDKFTDFIQTEIYIGEWMEEIGKFRISTKSWVALGFDATMVNAYYDPEGNLLQLMAAIMQQPFFSASVPKYIYYATMGVLTGHEITHGFDTQGVAYDADGAKKNWWDESSKMNFDEKSECMLDQYIDYIDKCNTTEAGGPIPYLAGNHSLGEIIADNGGVKLAYLAYKKLSDQTGEPEPNLPNLEQFTRDQMFFISLGNLWCTLEDIEKQRIAPPEDEHPPSEFRVNGVLKNFPQFSEAFDCKAGTNMNPKNKCSVW